MSSQTQLCQREQLVNTPGQQKEGYGKSQVSTPGQQKEGYGKSQVSTSGQQKEGYGKSQVSTLGQALLYLPVPLDTGRLTTSWPLTLVPALLLPLATSRGCGVSHQRSQQQTKTQLAPVESRASSD